MEIVIGKTAGFCFGVANAVNKTSKLLEQEGNMYCLGELVHNKQVTEELKEKGLEIIESINEAKGSVIIRSHGVCKSIYDDAKEMGIKIEDLTCPKVLKIHNIAEEYSKKRYYIFLIGNSSHPETIGTISYCGENSSIIEKEEDLQKALEKFYASTIKKLLVLVQTTFSLEKFNNITNLIKENIEDRKEIELEIKNTICDATKIRQEETKEIAKKVDMMIIIGGKNSSNTKKLYEISEKYCKNCILVETYKEIDTKEIAKVSKIGIMAGASTPQKSIDKVVEMLNKIC